MLVNQLNNKLNNSFKATVQTNNTPAQIVNVANQQNVCSPETASALQAKNKINNTPYKFLQDVKLQSMNLNGKLYLLPNGQKCLIAPKSGPCVIETFFNVGSMNEPDHLRGISHYIEHNLFNGSKNLAPTEFVEQVNSRGGKYNACTTFSDTSYYISSPLHKADDLEHFIKIHADMISNPTFSQEMLDKERGPVISEIQMYEDKPENTASNTVLRNLFNIKSKSPDLTAGTVDNIKNITRDDVINYYKTYYTPDNAITVVVGDVDEKQTLELLSKYFADFKTPKSDTKKSEILTPISHTIRQDITSKNTQSAIIELAFVGERNNKEKTALNALLSVLCGSKNGKLTVAMQKMNLSIDAGIQTLTNNPNDPTAIRFATDAPNEKTEEVLKELYTQLHKIAYTPISQEELNVLKSNMKFAYKVKSESNMDIAETLGINYLTKNNFDVLINAEKNIDKLTAKDIMLTARKFLDLNKASICVIHPGKSKNISFSGTMKKNDIKTYITPNNAQITMQNIPDAKLCSLNFEITSNEFAKKAPLLGILVYMLSKGTSLMSENEFVNINDKNNISNDQRASYCGINLHYSFPKESMPIVLSQMQKKLFFPAITKENFEKAKEDLKNNYYAIQKRSKTRAIEELYKETPLAYTIRKEFEDIEKITYGDVIEFYNNLMQNPKLQITASGDFSDGKDLNNIYSYISNIPKTFTTANIQKKLNVKPLENNIVITEADERNQADIVKLFRIKETGNIKDEVAITLLNEILGGNSNSRIFNDLREKQKLAYSVYSDYCSNDKNYNEIESNLALRIQTTTNDATNPEQFKNLQKAINGFNFHINKLINEKVSDKELEAAKLQVKSKLADMTESTNGKNIMLSNTIHGFYKEKYLEEVLKAIDNTTANDIQKIAKYYLTQPSITSIVASKDTLQKNAEYLKTLGEVKSY